MPSDKDHPVTLFIERTRRNDGIAEVHLNKMPNWFRWRWLRCIGADHTAAWSVHQAMQRFESAPSLIDHWGTMAMPDGKLAFVTEPYAEMEKLQEYVEAVANVLKCNWFVSEESWWYPTRTIRGGWFEGPSTVPLDTLSKVRRQMWPAEEDRFKLPVRTATP